jgi:hypothetical protein
MSGLRFEDPISIIGLVLVYASLVFLWGMYGCYPYHHPPWPMKPAGILDNVITSTLFLGISFLTASYIIQRVEVQRSKSTTNALCGALAKLTVFTFMRIANEDAGSQPSIEDDKLWYLFLWGGKADASSQMYDVAQRYSDVINDDVFKDAIFSGELDLAPRTERYFKDTESLRRGIQDTFIPMTMSALNDEDAITELGRYAEFCANFERDITEAMSDKQYKTVINDNTLFLELTERIYGVLKDKRSLHPIGALYGPEDPPEICV